MCSSALLTISSGESLSLLAPLLRTGSYVGAFKGMIIVVLYFRRVLCYFLTFFLSLQAAGLLGIGRYKSHFLDIEHFREMNGRIGDKPLSFQTMLNCYDKLGTSGLWASSDPDSTTDITREQNHSHCPVHTEFCHCAAEDGISHNPITEDSILPHLAMPDRVRAFMAPHEYHFFTRRACDPSWSLDEASRRHCHIIPRFK